MVLVVVTALAFDFTNGFHDTGNAMATSIATGALKPKVAVGLSAILNLIGAFLSVEVAATITKDVLNIQTANGELVSGLDPTTAMTIIFAGLIGGILWNLLTWLFGLPSSSSHALFGGLVGAGLAAVGTGGVNWSGIVQKILVPAAMSPFIAGVVAAVGAALVYMLSRTASRGKRDRGFRWGQVGTASLVSLAHGTGDAQKTMGVIALALIAHGSLTTRSIEDHGLPVWIIVSCALAIALGTYLGGWRVISWALVFSLPVAVVALLLLPHPPQWPSAGAWLSFGYVSVISMFLAFFAWYKGLALGGVARADQVQLVQPVLTLLWSVLLLGEALDLKTAVAAAAVVGCALLSRLTR